MNNRELYKRTFSHVRSSSKIRWEDYAMEKKQGKRSLSRRAAAAVILAVLLVGTAAAAAVYHAAVRLPAVYPNLTRYSAELYGVDPFEVSIQLPEGCTLSTDYIDPENATGGWSPVELQMDGKAVGVLDYNIFELYPDGPAIHEPGFYRMVYNQLMLQVQANWDNGYRVVSQDEVSENAVTQVAFIRDYGNGRSDNEIVYHPGILAYNTDLMVYVNIRLEPGVFTDEEIESMAASVSLSR